MGIEQEMFVHPDRISEELICPICQNVVDNPVQTPSEHLFCEDELLEWLVRSSICPVTNKPLDASTIKPPGRIITNMLASLDRYCPNKGEGCEWTGKSDQVKSHYKTCSKKSKSSLIRELEEKDILIALLKGKISATNHKQADLQEENNFLKDENIKLRKKIKVYEAFFNEGTGLGTGAKYISERERGGGGEIDEDSEYQDSGADDKQQRQRTQLTVSSRSSDAANLAKLRNYEKSVYL